MSEERPSRDIFEVSRNRDGCPTTNEFLLFYDGTYDFYEFSPYVFRRKYILQY